MAVENFPHKVASQSSQAEVLVELWHASRVNLIILNLTCKSLARYGRRVI